MKSISKTFRMHYRQQGSGIPILLVHGYPLNRRMWDPQFSSLGLENQLIAPDLWGFGQSKQAEMPYEPKPYHMESFANDCANLLDELHIDEQIILCGLSMGGYIAFEFYRLYPDRVSGLILAATRAGSDTVETKANRDKSIEMVTRQGINPVIEGMLSKLLSTKTFQHNPQIVNKVHSIMAEASTQGITGSLLGMKERKDFTLMLHQIACPTLVIAGTEDQIIPLSEAKIMEESIPNAKLALIEEAGHLPNLEQPDCFNKALVNFLGNF